MITRISKIAQLPKPIRDELNYRLENGKQSPELLNWLNALAETKKLLADKFHDQPITKSNLSDWRHGGYHDWLKLRAREQRIQRVIESGDSLKTLEGESDLFENFARMVIAELAHDLETLHNAKNREDRWQRLRELSRELARLQNGFNRSRSAELAWVKWNDRDQCTGVPPVHAEEFSEPETQNLKPATSMAVVPDGTQSQGGDPHDSESPEPEPTRPGSGLDVIHHTKCECGEPCPKCHAPDSEYPLDEALRDKQYYKKHGRHPHDRDGNTKHLINCECECFCDRCAEKTAANLAPTRP